MQSQPSEVEISMMIRYGLLAVLIWIASYRKRFLPLILLAFLSQGCAHVIVDKLDEPGHKEITVSFNLEHRVDAKSDKADKIVEEFCAPGEPKLMWKKHWMHYDSGFAFTTRRGVTVDTSAYERWFTAAFECVNQI